MLSKKEKKLILIIVCKSLLHCLVMFLSNEIRHDIIELFPTLLNKEIHFKLVKEIHLPIEVESFKNNNDIYQKEYRWKISLFVLKRLDSIDNDWNITPHPLLHSMPILYFEQPINSFCETINKWNYIEKLKYFPVIKTLDNMQRDDFIITINQKKMKLNQSLITRLNLLDQLTMTTNKPVINNNNNKFVIIDNYELNEITTTKYKSKFNTFLPQKNLNDYKVIQTCLKDKRREKRNCELDNFRFQFD